MLDEEKHEGEAGSFFRLKYCLMLANEFELGNDLLCILSSPHSAKEGDGHGNCNGQCKFDVFFFRLIGILGPQWNFGSTQAL